MRGGLVGWRASLLYAVAYVGTALATESLTLDTGFTPWYPPAGITLAYLVAVGPRAAPVAFAVRLVNTATVFPEAWRDEPAGVVLRGLAITAAYTVAAAVLRRVGLRHARLRELGWFAFVGVAGAPLAGSLAVAAVEVTTLGGTADDAFDAAFTFWVGDAVAVAGIVPAVLLVLAAREGLVRSVHLPEGRTARLEAFAQAAALILVPVAALALSQRDGHTGYLALALVPAVWVALRRDLVLAAIGLLVLTTTLSVAASRSYGTTLELTEVQAVLLAAALAALYVAAATHGQEVAVAELLESEGRYRGLVDSAPDLVARLDLDGAVRFASEPVWAAGVGGVGAVLEGLRRHWDEVAPVITDADAGTGADPVRAVEWEQPGHDGIAAFSARVSAERAVDGRIIGAIAVVTDRTAQRRAEVEREVARRRDPVTALLNRVGLRELLDRPVEALGADLPVAVAAVDLDGFKAVNVALGHSRGDELLRDVGQRLVSTAADHVAVARVGADEFAIAFPCPSSEAAARAGDALVEALRADFRLDGEVLHLSASVGVAVGRLGDNGWDVFCDADTAMHAAKEAGRGRCVAYDASHRAAATDRRAGEALLRARLAERSLAVHYQPVADLRTGEVTAAEALCRLRGFDGELVFPGAFVPVAEQAGLDVELGTAVLDAALAQLAAWAPHLADRTAPFVVHVNVTARQLVSPGFADLVLDRCRAHGVAPSALSLELTETLVMTDPEAAIAALAELRANGVGAALDDFGTGYSSIAYLSRLPVTGIKVDRSFVSRLPEDDQARAVVGLVAGLSAALGLDVIAEGIETDDQLAALVELGCTHGQGFLLARPAPPATLLPMLRGTLSAATPRPVPPRPPAPS